MGKRKLMKDRYRNFSFLSDIEGIKNAIGEMRGMFLPPQPVLNQDAHLERFQSFAGRSMVYSDIKDKIASHPDNVWIIRFMVNRFYEEPLVGFVRGNDPILEQYKEIIGPHHFTPWEIMRWQAEKQRCQTARVRKISV